MRDRDTSRPPDHADVIAFPPLIVVAFAALGGAAHYFWPRPITVGPVSIILATVSGSAAIGLALWGARELKRAGTAVNPYETSTAIVTSGPYAHTRNPLYLSIGLLFVSFGFGVNSRAILCSAVPWFVVMHFGVVLREERYLTVKFGATYTSYKERVRRWL